MGLLATSRAALAAVLDPILALGRLVAWISIGLMTIIILVQVVFRYLLGNALPWPDEAARFLMLWMTALIAPSAYRQGGFVSIDLVSSMLPRRIGGALALILLLLALIVLLTGVSLGLKHVNSGWLFASSTLRVPMDLIGMKAFKIKLAWMYLSLLVGIILLAAVNLELILKAVTRLIEPDALPEDKEIPGTK
ncbi:MAG: TRAP transporter small permease subunit [Pseudomonadota bacterium]